MNDSKRNRKLLGTPYYLWSAFFIIIPLGMVFYYGLTDRKGAFTFENIAAITQPEHIKGLFLALGLSFLSTIICILLLSAGYDFKFDESFNKEFCCFYFHSSDVDELPFKDHGLADTP